MKQKPIKKTARGKPAPPPSSVSAANSKIPQGDKIPTILVFLAKHGRGNDGRGAYY